MRKAIILALVAFFMSVGVAVAGVNVNTATQQELTALPGIGAVKAEAIIDYRKAHGPFDSVEALTQVKGIGKATVAHLKDEAEVGDGTE